MLSREQQQKLSLLTTHVANHCKVNSARFIHPVLLHRFLAAKQYNIEKAMKHFDAYWTWRMANHIDALILDDFSRMAEFRSLMPKGWYYNDKSGRPVLIEQLGQANLSQLFKVISC